MSINLSQLSKLQELFKLFSAGTHLNRLQETELWVELENHQVVYERLFAALGFSLVLDGRGFAYFKSEQGTGYTGKLTRRLALLLMLLFEYQADQGLHLFQFQNWRIDAALIDTLWQQYRAILEAEEFAGVQTLKEVLDSAARVGFVTQEEAVYRLLPAVHRYLDLFEELGQAERPGAADAGEESEEHTL
jgi:hypothetical protein